MVQRRGNVKWGGVSLYRVSFTPFDGLTPLFEYVSTVHKVFPSNAHRSLTMGPFGLATGPISGARVCSSRT